MKFGHSFIQKQKTKSPKAPIDAHGNIWTWTALCPETKLIATWLVGDRSQEAAYDFIEDLSKRFSGRIQLTSDGYKAYTEPVHASFGNRIDYAQYVKKYDHNNKFIGADKKIILGNPDPKFINTTYVERQNLTMRTCIRRFARQTNAFSKKLENHSHALALYFMHYNFCRIHKTLRVTPAMEAGLTNHVWMMRSCFLFLPQIIFDKIYLPPKTQLSKKIFLI